MSAPTHHIRSRPDYLAVRHTGTRRGAMLALRFADVAMARGLIILRGQTTKSRKTRAAHSAPAASRRFLDRCEVLLRKARPSRTWTALSANPSSARGVRLRSFRELRRGRLHLVSDGSAMGRLAGTPLACLDEASQGSSERSLGVRDDFRTWFVETAA